MFKLQPISKAVALAFGGVTLAVTCGLVSAQTVERIEITGSSIKQIQSESALPVQTYTRQDMERTGATTAAEVIQNLPALQGSVSIATSVGGSPGGFQGASLHLQGDSRTLVLLNGRRIAPFAGTTLTGYASGVDLATIPLAAIERVEILSDGASALYGADAIGGVINFILRSNYSEGDIGIGALVTEGGGAGEKNITITKGWGDLQKDGYNLLAAFSYNKQDELAATQRDFAKTGYFPLTVDGRPAIFFNLSANGVPANFAGGGLPDFYNPYRVSNDGACPPDHYDIWDTCYFDYVTTVKVFPEMEQSSLLLSGQKKLNANHTAFADVMVARSTTTSRIAPPPISGFTITSDKPAYQWLIDQGYALDGTPIKAYWRGMDAGNRTTKDETTATHVVVGVKGVIGAWDYTTSYTHSENQWKDYYTAGWLKANEMSDALAAGSFNPFLEPGMQTPEGLAAIQGMVANQLYKQATTTLDFIEARGSREVGKVGGGSLMLGTGFDYRREGNKYEPSQLAQGIGNNIAGDSANEVPFDLSRNAWGAYAELLAPLTKQLEVTGSVRYDKYSDFGASTNGKLAIRYQPAPNLLLRGSVGTGFKAPTLAQAADIQQSYGVTANNYGCPWAPGTDPLAALCAPGNIQYNMFAGGNPDLKPEESTQWTLGFRVEPTPKLSLGMDLWNIHVKNQIDQISETTIFEDPVKYYDYFTSYDDPLGGPTLAILAVNANLGQSKARGIDFDAKARFDTKVGKLTVNGIGTYMLDYKTADEFGVWTDNLVGKYDTGDAVFRLQARVAATLEYGRLNHTLAMNYKSGYSDFYDSDPDSCAMFFTDGDWECLPQRSVSSYLTFDWQTKWSINKQAAMVLGIRNLFDTNPPFTFATDGSHAVGYDPRYTDPRGRLLYVNFNHKF